MIALNRYPRVALLWSGDAEARKNATAENSKFRAIFETFAQYQVHAEPAVYYDACVDEVRQQLQGVDGVLVWVDPLQGGTNRTILDNLLREVAAQGVFVSTHPDIILKMGTKEVLFHTQNISWGGDIALYPTKEDFHQHFPARLATGASRVLKQYRGNGGMGIWRVELLNAMTSQGSDPIVRVLHALRNSREQQMPLSAFMTQCDAYFVGSGSIIDQPFFSPVPDGMVRCYLSQNEVVGFGHQYVTALLWPESGQETIAPQPRLYYPESQPEFQVIKRKMESEWLPQFQQILAVETEALPMLWDADFLFGPKTSAGEETYILCEINVSSVHPFPDSAVLKLVQNVVTRLKHHRS